MLINKDNDIVQPDLSLVKERLLLVDDEASLLELLSRYISSFDMDADIAKNGKEAVELLQRHEYGVIVTDMVMPEMDGMELLQHVREFYPQSDVLVISGYTGQYGFTDLITVGATDFISKPFKKDELHAKLQRIFRERHLIKDLYKAKAEAELASQVKSDFLNTISHELRTPMNGILGFSSLLCNVELNEEHAEYMKLINRSAERLMELVNQILNFANLDARKQNLHPGQFNLEHLVDNVLLLLQPKLEVKGLELQVNIAPSLPEQLIGDADVLALVMSNLVDNAIKFSDNGCIVFEALANQVTEGEVVLQVNVQDDGCGIPEHQQENIFNAFAHAESYITRRQQGVGLGLSICSRLVSLMDGQIGFVSRPGAGSTFTFTVTLRRSVN